MPTAQFLRNRQRGKTGQQLLTDILSAWNLEPELVADGYFPDYDIKINTGITIEVKTDYKAHLTGNICLELEALNHSKADILAYTYGIPVSVIYWMPLKDALALAERWPFKKQVGEHGETAALIPRRQFLELLKPKILELQQNA
jgi:hypothetical protein